MNGTFEEVVAWIEGYTTNARKGPDDARFQLNEFNRWLATKRNYSSDIVAYTHLRETYHDDGEALAELAQSFREFASERENRSLVSSG